MWSFPSYDANFEVQCSYLESEGQSFFLGYQLFLQDRIKFDTALI